MLLRVLGSGSSGNGYILFNGAECLILEAGVPFAEVRRGLDFNTGIIAGCRVSHEHGDHAAYAADYIKNTVDIYASQGTLDAAGLSGHRTHTLTAGQRINIGGFGIIPFDVKHDAAAPLGFLIRHKDMGTLLFATDTYYLPNRFAGLNHIMVECSYAADILEANDKAAESLKTRMLSSHMELGTCKDFLRANDLSGVSNIILLHVSFDNGDKSRFIREITALTGKPVHVAWAGLELELGITDY
jgi:phosphoribosyl 1,2-cyclic phosphodiesterase